MNILVLNGPNLNLLGKREESIYGSMPLDKIEESLKSRFKEFHFSFFQSNIEGELVTRIQEAQDSQYDAIIINPAAYTHTSVAICDALRYFQGHIIEVHLSNTARREDYRQTKITTTVCDVVIEGAGWKGYVLACELLKEKGEL